jgi:hypothetical protein
MAHLRQEGDEVIEDAAAVVGTEAWPDAVGLDGHGDSPSVARRIRSRIASRVSLVTGWWQDAEFRSVAVTGIRKTASSP